MARVFSKLRTAFADEKFDLSQAEIKNFLGYLEEKDLEASVTKMLNFLEAFSLFVNQGLIEENLSKKLMRGVVIKNYQKLNFILIMSNKKMVQAFTVDMLNFPKNG